MLTDAAATAVGLTGFFGYLSTLLSGVGFGTLVKLQGWNAPAKRFTRVSGEILNSVKPRNFSNFSESIIRRVISTASVPVLIIKNHIETPTSL